MYNIHTHTILLRPRPGAKPSGSYRRSAKLYNIPGLCRCCWCNSMSHFPCNASECDQPSESTSFSTSSRGSTYLTVKLQGPEKLTLGKNRNLNSSLLLIPRTTPTSSQHIELLGGAIDANMAPKRSSNVITPDKPMKIVIVSIYFMTNKQLWHQY